MAMTYNVNISISDGHNTMAITDNPTLSGDDNLKDVITFILKISKNQILDKFPTNQWIYQWIISSELDGSLESFFTAFNVKGDRNLMSALLNGGKVSDLPEREYVLAFDGY